jgi:ribonuclease-3
MTEPASLDAAEQRLGHKFKDRRWLAEAFTHSSGKSEALPSNERLEFLGDSILGAVIARHLFRAHPEWDEGDLTRVKSAVVSAETLARASRALGLPDFFVVGKGLANQERFPTSLLANVFEALVAAIYLDGGDEAAERFVLTALGPTVEQVVNAGLARNWKSILQQYAQKVYAATPTYRVTREEGPDHVKRFEVVARIGERELGRGDGHSKKEAEQRAAEATLRALLGPRADATREGAGAAAFAAAAAPAGEAAAAEDAVGEHPAVASPATNEAHARPLVPLVNPPPRPPADEPPGEDEPLPPTM